MVENRISSDTSGLINVDKVNNPPLDGKIYVGDVESYLAIGESIIINKYLSNYLLIPLTTLTGGTFDTLANDPKYGHTYNIINNMFITQGIFELYDWYFSTRGEGNNGQSLVDNLAKKLASYSNTYLRLDQATNQMLKNVFAGLKPCVNYSKRQSGQCISPNIPLGADQSQMSINSTPNFRWGFNK
jgi:hypothetical protein